MSKRGAATYNKIRAGGYGFQLTYDLEIVEPHNSIAEQEAIQLGSALGSTMWTTALRVINQKQKKRRQKKKQHRPNLRTQTHGGNDALIC